MGEHKVGGNADTGEFAKALLRDVQALERLLQTDAIERGVRRIGAEQELFLVTPQADPAPIATEVLLRIADERMTTELARFNLEANLSPQEFAGDCLSAMETELRELIGKSRTAAQALGADVVLTGILPTLRQSDLSLDNMTPSPRYEQLNRAIRQLRGREFRVRISGIDELEITHDNVMLEACSTSFQIHFQVAPDEFAKLYNLAQVVSAPVLAAAVNSPVLFRRRLWAETRVALFEGSTDARNEAALQRHSPPRVHFGEQWVRDSVLEIVRQDIARFRTVLTTDDVEDPLAAIERGDVPQLQALRLHTGTVWRWNRACYGVVGNRAHLRIENRVLPAGPTVTDEMANAAFFFGLMVALGDRHDRVEHLIAFHDAKANFLAAGQFGLRAQFTWLGGRTIGAAPLIVDELVPLAAQGLRDRQIASSDIDRYLGVITDRVRSGITGARWIIDSLAAMNSTTTEDARLRAVTTTMLARCHQPDPGHTWPLARAQYLPSASFRTVGQVMSTDLFTVRHGDIVDMAASLMDWQHIRHVPVEDEDGKLVGLVSHRQLLRLVATGREGSGARVEDVMTTDPVTVEPETPTLEAIALMRTHKVGCLPVLKNERLVGIVSERDFINVAAELLEQYLQGSKREEPSGG